MGENFTALFTKLRDPSVPGLHGLKGLWRPAAPFRAVDLLRPHPKNGKVISSQPGGGGLPHLHPIILPLVPGIFWGYPSDWSRPLPGGVPQDGDATPWPGQAGVPPRTPQDWGDS